MIISVLSSRYPQGYPLSWGNVVGATSHWYNRFNASDVVVVHYYFAEHRPRKKLILHLRIQRYLALRIVGGDVP